MTLNKFILVLLILPLCAFTSFHKYYVSVTQVEYVADKQAVQIISRIFIDDIERLLRERYDESITLAGKNEPEKTDAYLARYLSDKMKIRINGEPVKLNFLGKVYDADVLKCYLEIEQVKAIKSFEITNKVLFDIFEDQQNVIKTKMNDKQKSFILIPQKDQYLLKFE